MKVVAEGTGSGDKMYYTTAPGDPGGIIARDSTAGTNPLFYHYDRLGNVMAVTDANGAPYAVYTMEAFGQVLEQGTSTGYQDLHGTAPQPYFLTTKEIDYDTGLYYFNARWYDQGTGRFASASSFGNINEHLYSFANNCPVRFMDIDGENPFDWWWNWWYGNGWDGLNENACKIAEGRRNTCGDVILPDSLPIDEVQRQCNALNDVIIAGCTLPIGWQKLPAAQILSGSAKTIFPSELLGYSLEQIESMLQTGRSGIDKKKLQTAKKLLQQAKRLADKCGGKPTKRF